MNIPRMLMIAVALLVSRDKVDPITQKIAGSEDQRRDASIKRADIREILGSKTMREITLK